MVTDGERNHRFEIQRVTTERIGQDRIKTWETIGWRWGSLVPGSASEPVVSGQASPRIASKIEMLYFSGLTSKHRLKKGSRLFKIVGPPVDPAEDKLHHVVSVVELEFDEEAEEEA